MSERFSIAVVGSGPAGLSAAAHAAELGISHVLLEKTTVLSNTIYQYQKGKHVMAEPGNLPLRSPLEFEAGTRENVLGRWDDGIEAAGTNVRYEAEVVGIAGEQGNFTITLKNGDTIEADHIVFSIGLQGNIRKLGTEGQDLPFVQYQLDDPDEYHDETIVVVGGGDAGVENALGLCGHNRVFMINRSPDFAMIKEGNNNLITKAIENEMIECFNSSSVNKVITLEEGSDKPGMMVVDTETGQAEIPCDRVIARLGAIPPRDLVEACGIEFPSDKPGTLPVVSAKYESNVKGMYIIGALGGYPLIKQAMNQGYEVIEYILGNEIKPADHPVLEEKFLPLPYDKDVDEILTLIQERIPVFANVNALLFRELMLDSHVLMPDENEAVFNKNDYTNTFFTILEGEVHILTNDKGDHITLKQGDFFGEMGLISGRRRTATVLAGKPCVLIETPKRTMRKLMETDASVKRAIDEVFIIRVIQSVFAPNASVESLMPLAKSATLESYKPGEALFHEGDHADCIHLIRSGSVTISQEIGGREVIISYQAAGNYVGEMGVLGKANRMATVRAAVKAETVRLGSEAFLALLDQTPGLREQIQETIKERLGSNVDMSSHQDSGDLVSFLMNQGLGEATDVLLIDEDLCVGCDNCEKACAETHGGTSRLDRRAGPTYASIHVPTSCRHCEHPHCMKDCPPDAIHRAPNGEVFINDSCIGCGNCQNNCPYGVIQMSAKMPEKPKLWEWLLFGMGPGPGEDKTMKAAMKEQKELPKLAVKCDMCKNLAGGSACVRACPTGAAIRISPEEFLQLAETHRQ